MGIGLGITGYVAALVSSLIVLLSRLDVLPEMEWAEAVSLGTAITGAAVVFLAKVWPLIKAGKASPEVIARALADAHGHYEKLRSGEESLDEAVATLTTAHEERRLQDYAAPTTEPTPEMVTEISTMKAVGFTNTQVAARIPGVTSWDIERITSTDGYKHMLKAAEDHMSHMQE